MSDLVKYLRTHKRHGIFSRFVANDLGKAADLIEQLQAERDALAAHVDQLVELRKQWEYCVDYLSNPIGLRGLKEEEKCKALLYGDVFKDVDSLEVQIIELLEKSPQASLKNHNARIAHEAYVCGAKEWKNTQEITFSIEEAAYYYTGGKFGVDDSYL